MKSKFISKLNHCPHHPDFSGTCDCRKPKPKMIFDAKKEFDIDVPNSILVGDKNTDIEFALNAGITKCYLIKTGHKIEKNIFNVEILDNMTNLKCKY